MIVSAIIEAIESDKVLQQLRNKILSGKGTFKDTFAYNNRSAELLGAKFSEKVLELSLDDRVTACMDLLKNRYDDIMPLLDAVQKQADKKNRLSLTPKRPPFNAERAEQIGTSLRDLSVSDERIQRRARSAPETATRAIHDDYIEANAELRSSAGIKCYITRITDGKCCEWCSSVAGRYEYGSEPDGIFKRHDNCGCSVIYENGRERQDVWSKKTWTVPEDAGAPEPVRFTQEQAAAAGAEPPRVFSEGEARQLNDVKVKENTAKPEKAEGAYTEEKIPDKEKPYTEVQDEYEVTATPGEGAITRDDDYQEDNHKEEIDFADWLHNKYGGDIHIQQEHTGKEYPDYIWRGKLWELKSPKSQDGTNSALRKGYNQISANPGGVMINYGDYDIDLDFILSAIVKRMQWYRGDAMDIMLVHRGVVLKILRYEKR